MSEAEKKADEIIEKIHSANKHQNYDRAKTIALIHVNGIMREYENYTDYNQQHKSRFDFYKEVKTIIENK